ncbi:MAG: DUF1330 domain-containing protein [Paracoccaceae bacterium]
MADKATLVVTATPDPQEMPSVQDYLKGVMPLLLESGGTLVKRQRVGEVINGRPSGMVLVMDFEDGETVRRMFASDAYADLVPARDKGFSEMNILVTADM